METDRSEFTKEARSRVIGGSDAATILGLNPYRSILELYMEKMGLVDPIDDSIPMRVGRHNEPLVAEMYLETIGADKYRLEKPALVSHPDYPFMVGHIDFLAYTGQNGNSQISHGVECKTTNAFARFEWGPTMTDEVPETYLCQVQHYLALYPGLPFFDMPVLIGNNDFRTYRINRNEEFIGLMIEAEKDFYRRLMESDPPPLDGTEASIKYLSKYKFPQSGGDVIVIPDLDSAEVGPAIKGLKEVRARIAAAEAEEVAFKTKIMEFMGTAGKMKFPDGSISWSTSKDGTKIKWEEVARELAPHVPVLLYDNAVKNNTETKSGYRSFRPTFKGEKDEK